MFLLSLNKNSLNKPTCLQSLRKSWLAAYGNIVSNSKEEKVVIFSAVSDRESLSNNFLPFPVLFPLNVLVFSLLLL